MAVRLSVFFLCFVSLLAVGLAPSSCVGQAKTSSKADSKESGSKASEEEASEDSDDESEESEGETKEAKDKEKKPPTVKMKGIFVAVDADPILRRPNEWSEMRVLEAVAHGTEVDRGDVLIKLDTRKIDQSLADLEHDVEISGLSLASAKENLRVLRKSTPMSLENAERDSRLAAENLNRFLTVDKQASIESYEQSVKNAEDYLAYQMEELKQLESMYEADDLTEVSEEIVLKRTRDGVERSKQALERTIRSRDRGLEVSIPRQEEELEAAVKSAALDLQRAKISAESKIEIAELKLEKTKLAHDKLVEKLDRMKEDRQSMVIKSPTDGIVYYGECKNGKWSSADSIATMLRPGGLIKSNQVVLTIVQSRPVEVRTSVTEKDVRHVDIGKEIKVVPTAFPKLELTGKVKELATVPRSDGRFTALLSIELPADADRVMPGMTCEASFELPKDPKEDEDEADEDSEDEDEDEEDESEDEDEDDE